MPGTLVITTLSDGTNSTSATNCIQGSAKAWVNFNGSGGASIRASYNVSSVTRTATGYYTINFTNAMTDANYAVCLNGQYSSTAGNNYGFQFTPIVYSSSSVQVNSLFYNGGVAYDQIYMNVAVFR